MFGGPPVPIRPSEVRDPVGDYKLVHDTASMAERLFAQPGEIVQLDETCPNGHGPLQGRANKYTRSVTVWCPECTFRINR